ncbi:hypothetical protein GGR54DRAFT_599310 [Hypoxylon sp. NC1633]|nr:hypothetical protein GGR54DRAFT_599310 [Hypoxylon sp. NC1633]
MAKERADKPRREKAEKHEKKVSKDKVKKHKKHKKDKQDKKLEREDTPDVSGNEALKLKETTVEEPSVDASITAPTAETKSDKIEESKKKDKKDKKDKEDKKHKKDKKSKKAAIEALLTEDTSNKSSLPVRPASQSSVPDGGASLFAIDTNPTPIDPNSLAERADTMDNDKDGDKNGLKDMPPPSGLSREERRRIKLIERERTKIQKKMGIPPGSLEKADEVQKLLDKWTAKYDDKTVIRKEKTRIRNEKKALRIRKKGGGKFLAGKALKLRLKGNREKKKKAGKKEGGLSAPTQS